MLENLIIGLDAKLDSFLSLVGRVGFVSGNNRYPGIPTNASNGKAMAATVGRFTAAGVASEATVERLEEGVAEFQCFKDAAFENDFMPGFHSC